MDRSDTEESLISTSLHEQDSTVRYQYLIENVQDAVVEFEFVDGEPIVRKVNAAFEEIFGYESEDICNESLNDWIIPAEFEEQGRDIDSTTKDGEIASHQLTRKTADGHREFLHRSIPCDESESIDGIALYTDITERERIKQKRQLLTETSRCIGTAQTLRDGFETTLQSICDYTEWAYGEVWQPAATSDELKFVVGHTDDANCERFLKGSKDVTFASGSGLPGRVYESGAREWIADVSQESPSVFHRTELAAESGLHAALGVPVKTEDEESVVAVLVFFLRNSRDSDKDLVRDVTDVAKNLGGLVKRKQAEELVRRQNKQLEQFAHVISHDLRNPLNVAMGHTQMLSDDLESPHMEEVETAHERMRELIEGILTLARQGKSIEDPEPVSLAKCATQSWEMIQTNAGELAVETTQTVQGDKSRLQQLFENLFRNAIEHGSPTVTITVGDMHDGFYVADDGPGIPVEDRSSVFDFGQTTREDGTGFGLPIVKEIAEAHGWKVRIADSMHGGARFEIVGFGTGN
ncbi:PAS domain S-box protein [Natronolimnobius sp. AArcel1]|uniref:PAS domain-containing sensor histidine kinase n=1 Tax=Natronolimnobius sp. AArcel1 TaxID=1679093 RepID=UPI0013EC1010|nr:ATP-binding protein [Natronolimnobius sp. AArcel1]NGM70760.1 PAS domain S-box protein [Natronolimnobius sp. AArcel1]